MADDHRATEVLGIGVRALGAAHVRGSYGEIGDVHRLDGRDENLAGVDMVDREIEETLDLVGMEVACHHPVGAGRTEEVGGELGSDGDARTVLAVLACPSEVRDDGDDLVCGGALGRVDAEQELHQVLRRREGRLDEEHGGSPDAFHVGGLELSVTERGDLEVAEPEFRILRALGRVQSFDHFGCKVPGGPAGKDCHQLL